jgi:ABC-type dipeptide/oligopeptide/nickel transport system permease component
MGLALIAISAPVYFLGLVALFLFADDIGRFGFLPATPPTRTPRASARSSPRC